MANDPIIPNDARHQALFRLVGEFVTSWAHVEWELMFVTSGLLRVDLDRARILLAAQINFRAKRELILRLGRSYLPDEYLADFEKMMGQVKHLSEKRNMLAHRRVYYMTKSTFRFFSDEDPTQPNVWGRYQDVQLGTIRAWTRELGLLIAELRGMWRVTMTAALLKQSRLIPEPTEDRDPSGDPDPSGGEEPPPQHQPSEA